jgi:hypothetical protein
LRTKITGHRKPMAKGSRRCNKGARSPRIRETVRFRGKGRALQRAVAGKLARKGEDPAKTYMCTPTRLRRIVKLHLSWLLSTFASHPVAADRMAMLEAAGGTPTGEPLLSFGEWRR